VIRWAVVSVLGSVIVSGEVRGPPPLKEANLAN
jgi:hypothetical protein